jgi:membrane-associated phospholipid phosphatase
MSLLLLIFHSKIEGWYLLVMANGAAIVLISIIVIKYESESATKSSVLKILRYWYPVVMILFIFKENYHMVHAINPNDIDLTLIKIDYIIFGVNPTQWFYRFANPIVTEIMEIIYILYYLVIVIYGLELYLKKSYADFKYSVLILFLGFYLSYVLYLIFPAVGPRFYLHDFSAIGGELPGIFLTTPLRSILDFAESIPSGVANPQDYVQRDTMPSAHAEIVILLAYLSHKLKLKSFYFYLPYCILMIISTVYLRYHYVIDLIAGALLAFITVWIVKLMFPKDYAPNGSLGTSDV